MKRTVCIVAFLLFVPHACTAGAAQSVIFGAFAENGEQLYNALVLAESVRTFGGAFKDAPIWIYAPADLLKARRDLVEEHLARGARVKPSDAPRESRRFPFAGKVYAAARAETEASGKTAILVWMDNDTVVLREPAEFGLAKGKSLGYRPVTHQNIGSLYSEAPNAFWSRVFQKLSVRESALFPMRTVADGKTIRPYFNAGLLVVRPERGIMAKWALNFSALCRDPVIIDMCRKDERTNVFLHQAALTGAILNLLARDEMVQLSDRYNYPIFFKEMYGADEEFDTLTGVVTLRYDVFFRKPAPDWSAKLKGPAETVSWLKARLGNGNGGKSDTSTKMRFRFQHGGGDRG
jgi:hypothetical protein